MLSCLSPKIVYNKYLEKEVVVPCGKCAACTSLKSNEWTNRLDMESQCHRYTLFVTLTYADSGLTRLPVTSAMDEKGYDKAVEHSSSFISFHDGMIPCVNVRDIQLFFKKLRINLVRKLHLNEKERSIRYFVASEYGPTTFRPHYHILLWFDSDKVAQVIKEYIYQAWKFKNPHSSFESFQRRNRMEFVRGHAAAYVAGYLNCRSNLPPILSLKPFRTFHLQSTQPPIGSLYIQPEQVQSLLVGNIGGLNIVRQKDGRIINVPLWRSLESRFFPRCPKFSSLSYRERVSLYRVSTLFGYVEDYSAFEERFLSQWFSFDCSPAVSLVASVLRFEDGLFNESNRRALRRLFLMSRRLRKLRLSFGISSTDYVQRIENYYSRKEYASLVMQLKHEQDVCKCVINNSGLRYIPCMVDVMFYNNSRRLDFSAYAAYLSQFDLTDCDLLDYFYTKNFDYDVSSSFFEKLVYDNTKTRRKKEYVSEHPEFASLYTSNLLYYLNRN